VLLVYLPPVTCSNIERRLPHFCNMVDENDGPMGCYLTYESDSGGKLCLTYTKSAIPENAIGFWTPGPGNTIQGFKFKQHGGRSTLISGIAGGDANRKKYFSGWVSFIKLAKAKNGTCMKFPVMDKGVEVDVFGYKNKGNEPALLEFEDGLVDVACFDAIAVLPKHAEFLQGVKSIALITFLDMANAKGASSTL